MSQPITDITKECHADLREIVHWFGGWDELRKVIAELEEQDNERAFDRWSEERYSIDGIAYHNSQP